VAVNLSPTLSIASSHTAVACVNETITLQASGQVNSYTWTGQSATTNSISLTLTATTVFTVNGTDQNGCIGSAIYTQSIIACNGTVDILGLSTDVSCRDKNDARITVQPIVNFKNYLDNTSNFSNYQVSYNWEPSELCQGNQCISLHNLKAGTYTVTMFVTSTVTPNYIRQDTVKRTYQIRDENPPCNINIYNGVTPNHDGVNDTWQIENLELYPKNKVSIYNRWGIKIYEEQGYNNTTKSWPNQAQLDFLSSTTYFYIIELGDGSKPIKGWVEVMKE
jgi:gliding motility-associated-like protein